MWYSFAVNVNMTLNIHSLTGFKQFSDNTSLSNNRSFVCIEYLIHDIKETMYDLNIYLTQTNYGA